jgi:hypothetical protein
MAETKAENRDQDMNKLFFIAMVTIAASAPAMAWDNRPSEAWDDTYGVPLDHPAGPLTREMNQRDGDLDGYRDAINGLEPDESAEHSGSWWKGYALGHARGIEEHRINCIGMQHDPECEGK